MIRRIHLFALFAASLLIGSAATLSAQETEPQAPDNDAILKDIMNGQSSNYYPSLFMRYMAGDTTLTLDEYRHLYYGYAWQPEYEPFDKPEVKDKLLLLVAQTKDSLTLENAEQIVDYANEVMRFDPFSPGNLNFLIYGYGDRQQGAGTDQLPPLADDRQDDYVVGYWPQRDLAVACTDLRACHRHDGLPGTGLRYAARSQPNDRVCPVAGPAAGRREGLLLQF